MDQEYIFEKSDGCVTITGYEGDSENVTVPELIDDLPVNHIAAEAFFYMPVKSIELPGTVRSIGCKAFGFCTELSSVNLSEELECLDGSCFLCTDVHHVVIPSGIKEIISPEALDMRVETAPGCSRYYSDGTGLYEKDADGSLKLLSVYTDKDSQEIYEIAPKTVEIFPAAFSNIHSPVKLVIPDSVEIIAPEAFMPFFSKDGRGMLAGIKVDKDNSHYFTDEYGLWEKLEEGKALVRWLGGRRASFDSSIKALRPYSLAFTDFDEISISNECSADHLALQGTTTAVLDLEGSIILPGGRVENNTLLMKMFEKGKCDLPAYDYVLLSGYLTAERIKMALAKAKHKLTPADIKLRILDRLIKSGGEVATLCLNDKDPALFNEWLALNGHNSETLSEPLSVIQAYKGEGKSEARQMMSSLLVKKHMMNDEDDLAL